MRVSLCNCMECDTSSWSHLESGEGNDNSLYSRQLRSMSTSYHIHRKRERERRIVGGLRGVLLVATTRARPSLLPLAKQSHGDPEASQKYHRSGSVCSCTEIIIIPLLLLLLFLHRGIEFITRSRSNDKHREAAGGIGNCTKSILLFVVLTHLLNPIATHRKNKTGLFEEEEDVVH